MSCRWVFGLQLDHRLAWQQACVWRSEHHSAALLCGSDGGAGGGWGTRRGAIAFAGVRHDGSHCAGSQRSSLRRGRFASAAEQKAHSRSRSRPHAAAAAGRGASSGQPLVCAVRCGAVRCAARLAATGAAWPRCMRGCAAQWSMRGGSRRGERAV